MASGAATQLRTAAQRGGGLSRTLNSLADTIRMRARASQVAAIHDQILLADRTTLKPAFQDLPGPGGITRLCRQRCPRSVRRHAVMKHRPPRVVPRRRLGVPNIN